MLSPRQIFEDNIRPAELLLKVYRVFEHDEPSTDLALLQKLRPLVDAERDEGILVILNSVFLGVIRDRADIAPKHIRKSALCNLLRQAVVIACTCLETYLPSVMNAHFEELIRVKGRGFINIKDKEVAGHLESVRFNLSETLQLLAEPAPLVVANKVRAFLETNLSGRRGVHVVGVLFSIQDPLGSLATKLGRMTTELGKFIDDTISRRNDIVHRADRNRMNMAGESQPITLAFAMQAVDSIRHVVTCLDEMIQDEMKQLRETGSESQEVA